MPRRLATLSAVLLVSVLYPAMGWAQAFTKIGKSSGINPAANSIRKLFGVHFVDLDGDGHLDFYAGQHANNTVRVTNSFMQAVEGKQDWNLLYRTTNDVARSVPATSLWDQINYAAWSSADPGR